MAPVSGSGQPLLPETETAAAGLRQAYYQDNRPYSRVNYGIINR